MKKIQFSFVSAYDIERQLFEGTCNSKYFSARFSEHLLVISYKGKETCFLEGDGWSSSESKRKELIKEFLEWA